MTTAHSDHQHGTQSTGRHPGAPKRVCGLGAGDSCRLSPMGDTGATAERFVGMTLTEVASALGWNDAQIAAHLADLAQVEPVDLTPGDLERVARLARQAETDRSHPLAS